MLLFVISIFFPHLAFADGGSDAVLVEDISQKLKSVNQSQPTNCSDCALQDRNPSCYDFLDLMYRDDLSKVVTIAGGASECYSPLDVPGTAGKFKNAAGLQTEFQRQFPNLGTLNHNQIKYCALNNRDPDSVQRNKISKFYYFMEKLDSAATTAYEKVSKINNLLSDRTAIKCIGKGSIDGAFNRCSELNAKCLAKSRGRSQDSELMLKAKESEKDETTYKESQKYITELNKSCAVDVEGYKKHGQTLTPQNPQKRVCEEVFMERQRSKICTTYTFDTKNKITSCQAARDSVQTAMAVLEDKNPWFKDKKYFKSRESKSSQDLIKEFMLRRNAELEKKVNEFQTSALCMNGFKDSSSCDLKKVRASLMLTPEIEKPEQKTSQSIAASIYLNSQSCVEIKNEFNAETVKVLKHGVLDVGLVVATAGFSSAYTAARLVGNATKTGMTLAALTAANAVFATRSFNEAAKACGPYAEKIELAASKPNECPSAQSDLSKSETDHASCMMAAAFAAIDIVTLGIPLPGGLRILANSRTAKPVVHQEVNASGLLQWDAWGKPRVQYMKYVLRPKEYNAFKEATLSVQKIVGTSPVIGLGRSPAPVMAMLSGFKKNDTKNIALSKFRHNPSSSSNLPAHYKSKEQEFLPLSKDEETAFFKYLDESMYDYLRSKKGDVYVLDVGESGASLFGFAKYLQVYAKQHKIPIQIKTILMTNPKFKQNADEMAKFYGADPQVLVFNENRYIEESLKDSPWDQVAEFGNYNFDDIQRTGSTTSFDSWGNFVEFDNRSRNPRYDFFRDAIYINMLQDKGLNPNQLSISPQIVSDMPDLVWDAQKKVFTSPKFPDQDIPIFTGSD